MPFVAAPSFHVVSLAYADGFDNLDVWCDVRDKGSAQIVDICYCFRAVKLYVVKLVVIYPRDDVLRHVVNEDTDFLYLPRSILCLVPFDVY